MNKRVISLFLAVAFVIVSTFGSIAASRTGAMTSADLLRFQRLVTNVRGKTANVINYQLNGDGTYNVRLRVRDSEGKADQCEGDYVVSWFGAQAPDKNYSQGPCWYWFGVLGDVGTPDQSKLVGYGLAVRRFHALAATNALNQPLVFTQPDWWCTDTGEMNGVFNGKK